LPVTIKTNDYILGNQKLPAISISASKDKDGVTHISLVNIDANKMQDISININAAKYNTVSGKILTSKKLQDYNSFDNPLTITPAAFNDAKLSANLLQLKLPPFSVVVLTIK
jgi:alpha-L-arabinofuranosidase